MPHRAALAIRTPARDTNGGESRSRSAARHPATAKTLRLYGGTTPRRASSRVGVADEAAGAKAGQAVRLRERPSNDDIRIARASSGRNVSPQKSKYASSTTIVTSAGVRRTISRMRLARDQLSRRVVGIGQENNSRPPAQSRPESHRAEMQSRASGGMDTTRPPAALTNTRIHFKRRLPERWPLAARQLAGAAKRAHRQREQPFIQAVGQHQLRLADAEIRGAFSRQRRRSRGSTRHPRRSIARIASMTAGEQPPVFSLRCSRSAPARSAGRAYGHRTRTSIERACASSPSSRASVITVGARFFSPRRVIR